jgi:aspartyl-tRNA(Asn)/glutamyl-tRNA(Gln) amidotransferase subunit B
MYKAVIGLEVHCELNTRSKMFSGSKNEYSKDVNTNISVIDLAFPGILPVPNKEGVRKAIKLAMALNCEVPNIVKFDRKNYYYPDLPKGYQLTQMTKPFGKNGYLIINIDGVEKKCGIHQLHLEEDSASMDHYEGYSLLDYNRAGVPLVEIVTDPCFNNEKEVVEFLENLRSIIKYTDVSEASSDKGQLRVDVNISMMKDTDTELGTRAEIKNINSFNSVKETILYEIKRQEEILSSGGKVIQETRRWVDDDKVTVSMREKVDAIDYKYYVEPNIPVVNLSDDFLSEIKSEIPVLPYERSKRYEELGVSYKDARTLVKNKDVSDFYEEVLALGVDAKSASNWITTRLLGFMNSNDKSIQEVYMKPSMLAEIIKMVDEGKISSQQAKEVFQLVLDEEKSPEVIVKEKGMEQISDESEIRKLVNSVLDENSNQVEVYKSGKTNIIGFFVGQILKKSEGKANPSMVSKILNEEINKR